MNLISRKRRAFVFVAFILLACTSCTSRVFPHASPVKRSWTAALQFDATVPPETQQGITEEFNLFLENSKSTNVKFTKAAEDTSPDMLFHVHGFLPVSKSKQVGGVVISLLGIVAVPTALIAAEAPFYIAFWYFPKSRSVASLEVFDGENKMNIRRKSYQIFGPGFLKKIPKQNKRHREGYKDYFKSVLKYYDRELRVAMRKRAPTI